jgi:deoxyribodipyrimidine photo-lyase
LLESVLDLKRSLRDVGSDLLVAVGKPEDVIPRYLLEGGTNVVLTQVRRRRRSLAASSARPSSRPGRRRPSVGSR